jgi:microcystin degradation protein MlrC
MNGPCSATAGPIRVEGVDLMVVSEHLQMLDLNIFRCVGIEPSEKSIEVVKSMQHFRAAFGPIASQVLVVDAGGLCTPDVTRRTYRNLRRPVFPLDTFCE